MKTARDLIDHGLTYIGDSPTGSALYHVKTAIQEALRELSNAFNWSYFYRTSKIPLVAGYSTGTVAFDFTGGTYERMLTLSSGTWPTWAANGIVYIANIAYEVDERKSDTVITFKSFSSPQADIASGTSYTIYREAYPLPSDVKGVGRVTTSNNTSCLDYVHPNRWSEATRNFNSSAAPSLYTIFGSPDTPGSMAIAVYPYPDSAYQLDILYQRRCDTIVNWDYRDGTVSISSGAATVTGSGTTFLSRMAGAILRVSSDATNLPTGLDGANPYAEEFSIVEYTSATSLRAGSNAASTYSGVKYTLSDPIDIEEGAMYGALLRCLEKHICSLRRMKELPIANQAWDIALGVAKSADSRAFDRAGAGRGRTMRYIVLGSDQS